MDAGTRVHNICILFEHETYFIYTKFNSRKSCVWQVATSHSSACNGDWLCVRTRAYLKRNDLYIYACAFREIVTGWSIESRTLYLRIVFAYFFRRGCEVHRYITDRNRVHTHVYEERGGTSRNFCASEFCVWMFNGGFRTLLFTMATDLIKHRTRRAFRVASMELKHASARSHRAMPRSCIFLKYSVFWQRFVLY